MNIDVNNGRREPIEGIAEMASISAPGDLATVAVSLAQLIRAPRPNEQLRFQDDLWSVIRTQRRTAHVHIFTCKRIGNG